MEYCNLDYCTKPRYSVVTGLCRTHHHRQSLGYDISEPVRGEPKICKHDGCEVLASAKGLCRPHYLQQWRTGKTWDYEAKALTCSVEPCEKAPVSIGLCQRHYVNGKDAKLKGDRHHWVPCGISWCKNQMTSHNVVCSTHRTRANQYGLSYQEIKDLLDDAECAACGSRVALAIHHDHRCCDSKFSCGECVVAVLCTPCNKSAGACGDNPDRLRALANALELGSWRARVN